MSYLNFKSTYEKHPSTAIKGHYAVCGYGKIKEELASKINGDTVLVFDYYPGVREDEVKQLVNALQPDTVIETIDLFKESKAITEQMKYHLTDDRVFGRMYYGEFIDFRSDDHLRCGCQSGQRRRHQRIFRSGTLGDSDALSCRYAEL